MGAWGPAIFSDDLACDIRGDYRELLEDGVSDEEASARVIEAYTHLDQDEAQVLWLALAAAQAALGRLDDSIRDRALAVIDEGTGLPGSRRSRTRDQTAPAVRSSGWPGTGRRTMTGETWASSSWPVSSHIGTILRVHRGCIRRGRACERVSFKVGSLRQRSANSPQEVRPRQAIANDAQRARQDVSAGQTAFSGRNQR